jgi:hypothetical protein
MTNWLKFRPSTEQYRNFAAHVAEAHSWYKHLSLLNGQRFVVFVAPDAGSGRMVFSMRGNSIDEAELTCETPADSDFTETHPRLHHTWTTTKEYRSRFGFLDYSCELTDAGTYCRDAGPNVSLPADLVSRCSFVLYPYVSEIFIATVQVGPLYAELTKLESGADHPYRAEVLELAHQSRALEVFRNNLSEEDARWLYSNGPLPESASPQLRRTYLLRQAVNATMQKLQRVESDKIQNALIALDQWLVQQV